MKQMPVNDMITMFFGISVVAVIAALAPKMPHVPDWLVISLGGLMLGNIFKRLFLYIQQKHSDA